MKNNNYYNPSPQKKSGDGVSTRKSRSFLRYFWRGVALSLYRLLFFLLALSLVCCGWLVYAVKISYDAPIVREYSIESEKIEREIVIIMLTDLHGAEFGEDNSSLIEAIDSEYPDFVVMTGDMFNHKGEGDDGDIETALKLVSALSEKYPVYYSMGNHELERIFRGAVDVRYKLREAGAVVLERGYEDVEISGQKIRVGGIYNLTENDNALVDDEADRRFFEDFCDTDSFKLMLEHRPQIMADEILANGYEIDLALSGHIHGGQVILPFLGGVWGGNWGLFPKYCLGQYEVLDTSLIVSAGLCIKKQGVPRVNNPTEITKITIK